ncbi:MAG: alpha/beta hydrolase, partial [Firmicutes bacterium]|nr:alpha/beta hydrolase [Bacillota bacterium]
RYKADELAGFPFSVSAFRSMMELVQYITSPGAFAAVPDDLPILLIAGAEDPVGNYGAGVDEVYQAFRKAGKTNVTMKLYEGDRHEILNEDDRKDVYDYILNWVSPYALKK